MREQTITRLSVYEDSDQLVNGAHHVVRHVTFWCVDYTVSEPGLADRDYCPTFTNEAAAMAHVDKLKAQCHIEDGVIAAMDETKDERDERLHFERQQQVYLTYYQHPRGGMFSGQSSGTELPAVRDAELFEQDGYSARVLKVTVENGEPIARWVT